MNRFMYFSKQITKTLATCSLGLLCSLPLTSHADSDSGGLALGVVGAAVLQNPSLQTSGSSSTVSGVTSYGGGFTGELKIAEQLGVEADLLYLNHKFTSNAYFGSSVTSTVSSGFIEIPVLIRFRPLKYLNLGAGVYYSRVVDSWSVSAPNYSNQAVNYGNNDFGWAVAVGGYFPVGQKFSVVADVRFTRSLVNDAVNSGDTLKFADFQVLAGVRLEL